MVSLPSGGQAWLNATSQHPITTSTMTSCLVWITSSDTNHRKTHCTQPLMRWGGQNLIPMCLSISTIEKHTRLPLQPCSCQFRMKLEWTQRLPLVVCICQFRLKMCLSMVGPPGLEPGIGRLKVCCDNHFTMIPYSVVNCLSSANSGPTWDLGWHYGLAVRFI